ncbi:hypothetical protein [Aureispira anguillae]|uniref:Uncharacterized protein n=1 Tax=Aureispira anguillae TaxID=2864201 RepID=A0A915YLV2_9BACT|nr:hypothetical protein [Aureispira anguillae]BDS15480.1 hypothetical protein AsAng_0062640 [Aureispira anguillae]
MINVKEYRSVFFQDEKSRLPQNHNEKRFFRSYISDVLDIKITERLSNGKLIEVYYHETYILEKVKDFHQTHYAEIPLVLFQTKSKNTIFIETYKNYEFQLLEIFRFDEFRREKESLRFLDDYSLSQYNESIYANEQAEFPIKEKLFYPSLWQIHEEDMD